MKKILFSIILTVVITSLSCKKDNRDNNIAYKNGAVVLTFDDHYVNGWLMADSVLKKYNWRASFGLTQIKARTEHEILNLQYLEPQGHEIANHSLNHKNAIKYVNNHGLEAYLKNEVDSMNTLMNQKFNRVTSFVYPNGSHSAEIDAAMFNRFRILRSTSSSKESPKNQDCYFNGSHLVYAWAIDANHDHYSKELLTELLQFASDNHLVLILYAHRVTRNITIDYQVDISTLDYICNYVVENNMQFLTLSDLAEL